MAYLLLLILFIVHLISIRNFRKEIKTWKDRSDEFWNLYKEEQAKRLSSSRYIGGKHEFGHDYE